MRETYNYLFQYLGAEGIALDKNEFLYQMQSHPNYPSTLSVADTLTFFNVANAALMLYFAELERLPSRFVVLLEEINDKPTLYLLHFKIKHYYGSSNFWTGFCFV